MSGNNSLEHSYDENDSTLSTTADDFFDKSFSHKIEILSVRIEYDSQLPATESHTQAFGFFQLNEQLDANTINWYSEKIKCDVTPEMDGMIFILPHRYIMTGDEDIFVFNGRYFNSIDIIFGQEVTYWRYSATMPSGEVYVQRGETILEVGNCPCCIGDHFKRIVNALQKMYESNSS